MNMNSETLKLSLSALSGLFTSYPRFTNSCDVSAGTRLFLENRVTVTRPPSSIYIVHRSPSAMSTDKMQYQYLTTQQIKKDAGDDLIEHGPRDSSDRQGLSMLNETEQNVTYPNWPL